MISTGFQLALLGGFLFGSGLALIVWRLAPTHPDLNDTLARLSPDYSRENASGPENDVAGRPLERTERIGLWAMRVLPQRIWWGTPTKELALLRKTVPQFYGEKVAFALSGLVIGPLATYLLGRFGLNLTVTFPVIASLACAVGMFFLPNYNVIDEAKKARGQFARSLSAYIELVALERRAGSASGQALERAAEVADSWVFVRIRQQLGRTQLGTSTPWEALHDLADELGLPELSDLADIMRLSGESGAQVYSNLRARAAALRNQMLSAEVAKANAMSERMYIPSSLLGAIFMAILIGPSLLRVMT